VFAEVVAVEERFGDSGAFGTKGEGVVGHFGYIFEDYGVVGGFVGRGTPAEGGMAVDEAGGDGEVIDSLLLEEANDGLASFVDIAVLNRLIGEWWCDRDGAVEVVGVGGAEGWNGESCLGEAGGELGVGVDDGADGGEFAVEEGVGVEVGGGFEFAVDDFAVEVGDDHEFGDELVVVDAGGFDDDEAFFAVDAAGVAEGVEDEASLDEFEIGFEDLGAKFFEEEHRRGLLAANVFVRD